MYECFTSMCIFALCEISNIQKQKSIYSRAPCIWWLLNNLILRALVFRGHVRLASKLGLFFEEEPVSVNLSSRDKRYLQRLSWQMPVRNRAYSSGGVSRVGPTAWGGLLLADRCWVLSVSSPPAPPAVLQLTHSFFLSGFSRQGFSVTAQAVLELTL